MSEAGSFDFVDSVTSDVSFVARGRTAAQVFRAAAEAILAATVEDPEAVRPRVTRSIEMSDTELDLLLLRFLNDLIYLRDAEGLLLRPRRLELELDGGARLQAELEGEPLDASRHARAAEVKAVTAHGLRCARVDGGWEASATLDV